MTNLNCPPQNQGRPPFPSLYNPLVEKYHGCEQPDSVRYLENGGDIFRFTLYWTLIIYTVVFALPALWGLLIHFIPHRISRRRQGTRGGSGSTNNAHFSALSLDRQSNVEILSPRSSEPFLLETVGPPASRDRTVKLDNTVRRRPRNGPRQTIAQTFDSWTPNRTLRTFGRKHTDSFALAPTSPVPTTMSQQPARRFSQQEPPSLRNRSTGITCLIITLPFVFVIVGAVVGVFGSLVIGYLLEALRVTTGVRISTWLPLGWAIIQVHTVLLGCFTNMISFI